MNRTFLGTLLDLVYPRRCPVCDKAVKPFGSLICRTCEKEFVYIRSPYCMKCGKELSEEGMEYCKDCMQRRHLFDRGRALCVYKSMSDSIYRFKYKGRQEYGAYYAQCIERHLGDWIRECRPDAIVPVPIHNAKRRIRGYNQAEVLAGELGKLMDIPVEVNYVKRVRKTAPMKDLSVSERQNNLKRAFKICRNDVKLSTIVIIDDIYTTGSTIDEMSYELRRAGVRRIYFIALAIGKGL
mgnify:CR=1 FL=1